MLYIEELTKLYAYSCGLNFLHVVREKRLTGLYIRIEDIRFCGFINLTLIMYGFS